jgi:SAM-dependent methyltransferase
MHPTAMRNGQLFFEAYSPTIPSGIVVDVGAQDVNGSLKQVCPPHMHYVGVDFVAGKGVDVVLDDPYRLPFDDGSLDMVVSSSCFEHSQMFWVLFLEIMRVLKPSGLFYLNAPSNGPFHRYPVDCWRFYPDSAHALVTWAQRNGMAPAVLESFTSVQVDDVWNDFCAVFIKDATQRSMYPLRMSQAHFGFHNGTVDGQPSFINFQQLPQDRMMVNKLTNNINQFIETLKTP